MESKNDYLLVFFDEPLALVWELEVFNSGSLHIKDKHDLLIGSYDGFDFKGFLTKLSKMYGIEISRILSLSTSKPEMVKEKGVEGFIKFVDFGEAIKLLLRSDSLESQYRGLFLFLGRKIAWGLSMPEEKKGKGERKESFKWGIIDLSDIKEWINCMQNKMPASDRFFSRMIDDVEMVSGLSNSYLYPVALGDVAADTVLASAATSKLFFATVVSINEVFSEWFHNGIESEFHQVDIVLGGYFLNRIKQPEMYVSILEGLGSNIDGVKISNPFTVMFYEGVEIFVPFLFSSMDIEGYSSVDLRPIVSYNSVYIADSSLKSGENVGILQITDVGKRYSSPLNAGELSVEILESEAFCQTVFSRKCFSNLDVGGVNSGTVVVDCGTGLSSSRFVERFSNYLDKLSKS